MFFLLGSNLAISKHASLDTAHKKMITLLKRDRMANKAFQSVQTVFSVGNYEIVEVEKGSIQYNVYMSDLAFNKEVKEKYNMAYQKKDPEGYAKFLKRMENRKNGLIRWNQH